MHGSVTLEDTTSAIMNAELHLPVVDEIRMMYMSVGTDPIAGGFRLREIELALLEDIDQLDGKRIHVRPNGETYDDDTLGTDIIGADILTDSNCWCTDGLDYETYSFGDILVDFHRIEGRTYRVHVEMTLTDSEEDRADLAPEDFRFTGSADFTVTVDEQDPMDD